MAAVSARRPYRGRTDRNRQRTVRPLRVSSRGFAVSFHSVSQLPSFRSRAKKEGALFSRVPVEALRKPCVTHERDIRPTGRIPRFVWHTHEISQVSTVPTDALNATILELSGADYTKTPCACAHEFEYFCAGVQDRVISPARHRANRSSISYCRLAAKCHVRYGVFVQKRSVATNL